MGRSLGLRSTILGKPSSDTDPSRLGSQHRRPSRAPATASRGRWGMPSASARPRRPGTAGETDGRAGEHAGGASCTPLKRRRYLCPCAAHAEAEVTDALEFVADVKVRYPKEVRGH
jgi:hypothetical protein